MKKSITSITLITLITSITLITLSTQSCTKAPTTFRYVTTNGLGDWQETELPIMKETHPGIKTLLVNLQQTEQIIDGFGACFNELGWDALNMLTGEEKEEVIKDFFSPEGFNFSICRVPIGANDYSRDWYSLNDSARDFSMNYFSIERDKTTLIPYIKSAMEYNPGLKIWGSPWSPPAWMKVNDHYACKPGNMNDLTVEMAGREGATQFIMEEDYLESYALYFSKFVQAYLDEGVNLYAVQPQNEPNSCQNFPSCIWTASDQARFIGEFLGPQFLLDSIDTELWYGTYERPFVENVDTILRHPTAGRFIKGVGFQWGGKEAIGKVHEEYPDLKLMQTESECGDGSNDFPAAAYTWRLIKQYMENGANSYMYWNMILDETGSSHWGWKQNSLLTVNSKTGKLTRNPEFYLFRHLSHFVKPGAVKLKTPEGGDNALLFLNPGNELVAIVVNSTDERKSIQLKLGEDYVIVQLMPESFNSVSIQL